MIFINTSKSRTRIFYFTTLIISDKIAILGTKTKKLVLIGMPKEMFSIFTLFVTL